MTARETGLRWGRALLAAGAVAMLVPAAVGAAEADPSTALFTPNAIVSIHLTLPKASEEALEANPESDDYVEATFSLAPTDGTPAGVGTFSEPFPVGLRLKGTGSFRTIDQKAAFKIKFKEFGGHTFVGLKKLTLNNMVQDPSMLHETLSYELFHELGVPAPRSGYAYLTINDRDYGVYLNVETLDDVFLPRWFESTRHLYEADKPGLDVAPGRAGEFEVEEGDDEDVTDLEALIAAADSKAGDWSEGVEPVADLTEMSRMWAVERYVGHWDGYAGVDAAFRPNNYYLHSEDTGPDAGRFQMLPWGTDQTWDARIEFDEPAGGLLFNGCFADGDCQTLYADALAELQATVPALDLDTQAVCLAKRLAPWQALEEAGRREYDTEETADGVAATRDFIADRPGELAGWLGSAAPSPPPSGSCAPALPVAVPVAAPPTLKPLGPIQSPAFTPTIRRLIQLGRVWRDGRWLTARVRVPVSGRLRLRAWIGGDSGGPRACVGADKVNSAGWVSVHCRIGRAAWRRLASRALRVTVAVDYATRSAPARDAIRTLALPRRQAGS